MKTYTPISDYYQFKQRLQGAEKENKNTDKNLFVKENKPRSEKPSRKLHLERV